MHELILAYNAACKRVAETVELVRAANDADLPAAEAAFRDAQAEAERCQTNLARAEGLENAKRFVARDVPQDDPNMLGMDAREVKQYSILRAVNALVSGDWKGAEFEREASNAVAAKLGRSAQGFFLPLDIQQRDLLVGTATAGGHTVATDLMASSFIEMKRNRMAVRAAGATVMGGLVGNVAIPRQTGGATFYWVAENGAPTESQQAVDQVTLAPKTGGAYTDISRKLLLQSSIDVENFVTRDLAACCALGIDLAALHGTGANNQPTGLAATSGIGSVAGGTNGAAPTLAHLIALETAVAVANADIGNLSYMTNAKVRGKLKSTAINATYGDRMVWADGAAPLNGYGCQVSNQVSSTLTKGTLSGAASAIFFGNWADLLIGEWGTTDIMVDPYTGSTAGTVRVVALQDVDIAVRDAASFAAMLDVITT